MEDIFKDDAIYGNSYVDVEAPRPFNAIELSRLNTQIPGEVIMGKFSLACKLYVRGSNYAHFCRSLDQRSVATVGKAFDVTKVFVAKLQKPGSAKIIQKIIIPQEALL